MTTGTGNPIFATVGGDVSAATVSPDGGKTTQTLAQLAQMQNTLSGNIADVAQNATDANTTADNAVKTAGDAVKTAGDAADAVKQSMTPDKASVPNGYVPIDPNGAIGLISSTSLSIMGTGVSTYIACGGYGTTPGPLGVLWRYNGAEIPELRLLDTGNSNKASLCSDTTILPASDGGMDIGKMGQAPNNIFSKTTAQTTSDLNQKTVLGIIGADTYEEGVTLAKALSDVPTIAYQLNSSIEEKGAAAARIHMGHGAQTVEKAIRDAGLDPAKYALWTQSQGTAIEHVPMLDENGEPRLDDKGNPITIALSKPAVNPDGSPIYTQMLRYDQIAILTTWYLKYTLSDVVNRLTALEAKAKGTT